MGLFVMHSCDNPSCVNPSHLFVGTPQDNMTDKVCKGRQSHVGSSRNPPRGERNCKAKLTEDQVRFIRARHSEGRSISEIGGLIGWIVGSASLSQVVKRRTWRHVP
jgi:hypothetical protein